ncbi:MAG: helix-turn-helix transcriptional regulator [Spirochaetes bacterium]|nr:helix-turn-helix transcriptional regulator [Spirochaetota bacterium]
MEKKSEQDIIAHELAMLIRDESLVFHCSHKKKAAPDASFYIPGFPHIEIVRKGVLPLTFPAAHGDENVTLCRGGVLYIIPGSGVMRDMDTERKLLAINLHRDGIECYRSRRLSADKLGSPRVSYHTARPLNVGGMHTLRAIEYFFIAGQRPELLPLFQSFLMTIRSMITDDRADPQTRAHATYKMIMHYMREKCTDAIGRGTAAEEFGLSPDYITHLFAKYGDRGFNDVLTELRLEQAERYLRQGRYPVNRVGELCGFEDAGYFIKVFRRYYGMTPGSFMDRLTGK